MILSAALRSIDVAVDIEPIRETFFTTGTQAPSMVLTVIPPALPVPPPPPPPAAAPGGLFGGPAPAPGNAFAIGGAPAPAQAAPNPRPPAPAPPPPGAVQYRLEVNGIPVASQQGPAQPQQVQWQGGPGRSAIIVNDGAPGGQPSVVDRQGPWSLFRLIDGGSPTQRGDRTVISYYVGGREMQYSFSAGGTRNPFTMPALREFHCPGGL